MLKLSREQRFIFDEVLVMAWAASVQRANIYNKSEKISSTDSLSFRLAVLEFVDLCLLEKYKSKISENLHITNIEWLVTFGTKHGGSLLSPDGYKFGVAQKLLNLTLKYLWCLGHILEPPHCPVDRIVISKTSLRDKVNWTEILSADKYKDVIEAIRSTANKKNMSIARWELMHYGRR